MLENMLLTQTPHARYSCFDFDFGLCVATLTCEGQLGLDSCTSPLVLFEVRTAGSTI